VSGYRPNVIANAVIALLEGVTGIVRRVPPDMFKFGAFEGQPEAALKAFAVDTRYAHRFDVILGDWDAHGSTPLSNTGPYRNTRLPITIDIWTALRSTSQAEARRAQRELIQADANTAVQALMYRNNLNTDANGTETGIISGLLMGPDASGLHPKWSTVNEDWIAQIHRSQIVGTALVKIHQNVS